MRRRKLRSDVIFQYFCTSLKCGNFIGPKDSIIHTAFIILSRAYFFKMLKYNVQLNVMIYYLIQKP